MKILIVKLSAIGDVLHTLPALNAVRRRWPAAHITWLIESAAAPLIQGHPALNRVLQVDRKKWLKTFSCRHPGPVIRQVRRLIQALRDTRYDMVLDFQALLKSAVWIAMARADQKIGFDRGMDHDEHSYLFLNRRVPPVSMEHHALERSLMMLAAIGVTSDRVAYRLPIAAADRARAQSLLARHPEPSSGPWIAVNPMAKWETKLWRKDRFAEVADRLVLQKRARIVMTGSTEDRSYVEAVCSAMHHPALNLAGSTSLRELAAVYEKVDLLITTDTGPMHLAAAVDTPVVALFGPTAPWRTGPYGPGHQVIRSDFKCSPCFKRRCETNDCMSAITVGQVLDGAETILNRLNPSQQ